ncbi:ankyrin repeat domain-containing protein [Endozoicomonas atrinae]|uniref:ankyrin repeat domain-containing protein n=1 Tax=Endozoicomonas atrinae TaxID=1333660 RepID=UPI000A86DF1A|nr:ankyrin repeat domain-containing protein [Endozoicomonas atrinae]
MTLGIPSVIQHNHAEQQRFQCNEPDPERSIFGHSVANMPDVTTTNLPHPPVYSTIPVEVTQNWQDAYERFRTVWTPKQISNLELANALKYDVLPLTLLESRPSDKSIRKSVELPQLKEHLFYKMLNKVLSDDQRQGFHRIRQSFKAHEISDSELLTALSQKIIMPGFKSNLIKKEAERKNFIDHIQSQTLRRVMAELYVDKTQQQPYPKPILKRKTGSVFHPLNARQEPVAQQSTHPDQKSVKVTFEDVPPGTGSLTSNPGCPVAGDSPQKVVTAPEHPRQLPESTQPEQALVAVPYHTAVFRALHQTYLPAVKSQYGLDRKLVPADGNCFFTSAAAQIPDMDSVTLRLKMHEEAVELLSRSDQEASEFFRCNDGYGYSRHELEEKVRNGSILESVPADPQNSYKHLWGSENDLPLLARATGRPVKCFAMSPYELSAKPVPICFDEKGHHCEPSEIPAHQKPIYQLFNGVDHYDILQPLSYRQPDLSLASQKRQHIVTDSQDKVSAVHTVPEIKLSRTFRHNYLSRISRTLNLTVDNARFALDDRYSKAEWSEIIHSCLLFWAVRFHDPDAAEYALRNGAKTDLWVNKLHIASLSVSHLNPLHLLADLNQKPFWHEGAELSIPTKGGEPFKAYIPYDREDDGMRERAGPGNKQQLLEILLAHGCDIHQQTQDWDKLNDNPLHWAIAWGDTETALAIIEQCSDDVQLMNSTSGQVNRSNRTMTPLVMAIQRSLMEPDQLAVVKKLVATGRVNLQQPVCGYLPVEWASVMGTSAIYRLLLAHSTGAHQAEQLRKLSSHQVVNRPPFRGPIMAHFWDKELRFIEARDNDFFDAGEQKTLQ